MYRVTGIFIGLALAAALFSFGASDILHAVLTVGVGIIFALLAITTAVVSLVCKE